MVYANKNGELFDDRSLRAVGRTGRAVTEVDDREWIPLPEGATMVSLPGTRALGLDAAGKLKALPESAVAVGALLPQGYTRLLLPAYFKPIGTEPFPLFGYTAVGFKKGRFYVAATQSDDPRPWNPTQYKENEVHKKVQQMVLNHPDNRLYQHLQTCAVEYECVTSRNTFFGRLEGAIPVSPTCNAGCLGCISEQPDAAGFPSPQIRMTIRPTVEEMVDLMVTHLRAAGPKGVISFGQGCEGEPSLRGREIALAIRKTREQVTFGAININTNAGLTANIQQIVDAGLDLMRISTISALQDHYNAYYQPRGYTVTDVAASARYASERGVIVSLNYLVFPGISDQPQEIEAMIHFINQNGIKLVQLRNLNIDPDYYLERIPSRTEEPIGMLAMIEAFKQECKGLKIGSYTHTPDWYLI